MNLLKPLVMLPDQKDHDLAQAMHKEHPDLSIKFWLVFIKNVRENLRLFVVLAMIKNKKRNRFWWS